MGAICCEANPVENQVPSQLNNMAVNERPVNEQNTAQKNLEEDEDDNLRFIIGGSMHESDGRELAEFKDFEIVIVDDRNFILKHKEDLEPAIEVTMRQKVDGFQWIGLPNCLKVQLNAFSAEDVEKYPGTLLKAIFHQLHSPREELKDSEEMKKQIIDAAEIK